MAQLTLAEAARTVFLAIAPQISGEDSAAAPKGSLTGAWAAVERRLAGSPKALRALDLYREDPADPMSQQMVAAQIADAYADAPDDLLALAVAVASLGQQPAEAPAPPELPAALSADGVSFSYGYALIIGVGSYRQAALNVPGGTTSNDARALAALLRDPELAAYPDDQVRVLVDARATRTNILDELESLAKRAYGGTALIFFAGRGEPVDGGYALLPYDADLNDLAGTGVGAELFQQRVAKVRASAKRLVVLLNCCHAGGNAALDAGADLLGGTAPPADFYQPLAVDVGQAVISAARPGQRAGARSKASPRHTPFGALLLAALRGQAMGEGAAVGVFELFAHLRARVPADARHIWHQGSPLLQEPLFYVGQLGDNIAVGLRPGWQGEAAGDDAPGPARRLAELELAAAAGPLSPAAAAERDALLANIAG